MLQREWKAERRPHKGEAMKGKSGYRKNFVATVLPVLMFAAFYVLEFDTGHTVYVDVRVCESENFRADEVEEAASALKRYFFLNMPGFELRELSYEGESACPELPAGKDGARPGDVIIFESVYVRKHGYDGIGENNREQSRQWIMVRDSRTGKWNVDPSSCP